MLTGAIQDSLSHDSRVEMSLICLIRLELTSLIFCDARTCFEGFIQNQPASGSAAVLWLVRQSW